MTYIFPQNIKQSYDRRPEIDFSLDGSGLRKSQFESFSTRDNLQSFYSGFRDQCDTEKTQFDFNFCDKKIYRDVNSSFMNEIFTRNYENLKLTQINT